MDQVNSAVIRFQKSRKFKNMKLILNQVKKVASFGTNLVQCALMCLVNVVVWKKSKKYVTHIFLIQSRAGIELHLAWQFDKDKLYFPFGDKNTIPTLFNYWPDHLLSLSQNRKLSNLEGNGPPMKQMFWYINKENRWLGPKGGEVVFAK